MDSQEIRVPDRTTDRIMSEVIPFEGFTFDAIAFDITPKNETRARIRFAS